MTVIILNLNESNKRTSETVQTEQTCGLRTWQQVQIMPSKTSTIIYNPSNCTSFSRSFDRFIKVLINGKLIEIY